MEKSSTCTPVEEVKTRITKLQAFMEKNGIDGSLIVQKTDLYYFSATSQQGWLYIPVEGQPVLMIFKEYDRAVKESPLDNVVSLISPKKIPAILQEYGLSLPSRLGMELDVLPTNLYFQYTSIFRYSEVVDVSLEIRLVRSVKSDYEVELIREAARLSDKTMEKIPELLEPGKTELAVAGELEAYARSLGHQGLVRMRLFGSELFYGHLMFGASAAVPSYLSSPTGGAGVSGAIAQGPGFNTLEKKEPILVDYVFIYEGYICDHAKIFSLGRIADELLRAHDAMLDIQETAKGLVVPGVASGEVYEGMVAMVKDKGYEDYFMGASDRRIRFTGHGVGLELDEFPFMAKGQVLPIEKNMVIALEPKVIMPGKGVVGVENTHLVTGLGLETLTKFDDIVCEV